MAILFEHSQINGLKLSNRFMRSATWEGLADETGDCMPDLIERMVELARGRVGLVKRPGREMTTDDIYEVVTAYGQAAQRAKTAAFDSVQIHAAHGYLLSQFLSPAFNQRSDPYGGTTENRSRIVRDYISMCRPLIREPILIKRWQSGDLRKATCISCNGCFGPARAGRGILCVQDIQWKP